MALSWYTPGAGSPTNRGGVDKIKVQNQLTAIFEVKTTVNEDGRVKGEGSGKMTYTRKW